MCCVILHMFKCRLTSFDMQVQYFAIKWMQNYGIDDQFKSTFGG